MKKLLLQAFYLVNDALALPFAALLALVGRIDHPDHFQYYGDLLSGFPFIWGERVRKRFYQWTLKSFGKDVCIGYGSSFLYRDAEVGNHVYIGRHCLIGKVKIADHVLIGSFIICASGRHQHGFKRTDIPMYNQEGSLEQILVGHNVWLGNHALVMANVGDHAIVGAAAVVIKDVPPFAVVAGNPAKILRYRTQEANAD